MTEKSVPIRRVRSDGTVELLGEYDPAARRLELVRPGFPLLGPGSHAVSGDLPWVFDEIAPDGFLAARFARWYPELGLPPARTDWSAEDVLRAIARRGHDLAGDLVVGSESFARYEARALPALTRDVRDLLYEPFVNDILTTHTGSSVGGARPKFALRFDDGTGLLVKFTPPLDTDAGRRWGALLRVEAHAAAVLAAAGVDAVEATYRELEGRGYLEVERFDRVRGGGRRGHVTLFHLGKELHGEVSDPAAIVEGLVRDGHLATEDRERFRLVHAFSAAIANTDAHPGNYGLVFDDEGRARLAPAYDVVPMAFAPRHDELPDRLVGPVAAPDAAVRPLVERLVARVEADPAIDETLRRAWLGAVSRRAS